jgi:hypothetical protein
MKGFVLGLVMVLLLATPGLAYYALDVSYSRGNSNYGLHFNNTQTDSRGYSPCYPNDNCLSFGPRDYYVDYQGYYNTSYYGNYYGNSYTNYSMYPRAYGSAYTHPMVYGYMNTGYAYPTSYYGAYLPTRRCFSYWCYA